MTDTADWQEPVRGRTPDWLVRQVQVLEKSELLDVPVRLVGRLADALLPSPHVEAALRGDWFGHALHPLLTDFPLGAWSSASLLDLFGGRRSRPAATGLVAFGLAMTVPTAATGVAEWKAVGPASRRVGLVHAAANGTATWLYALSLVARLRGKHRRGVVFGLAGGAVATLGGYLGGHLSIVRKMGTADPAYGPVPVEQRSVTMSDNQQDAVEFLLTQHEQVRSLFATIGSATGETRREAFEPLVRLLAVHETAEEMVVYPALRAAGDEGNRIADARLAEEDEAKKVLSDLEKLDPSTDEFERLFAEFRTAVEAHAESEEREVFPLLRQTTDDEQLRRLASALTVAEGVAPTHPHKLAPESATGNMIVGPFVAIVDRVRDAIKSATS
jgi:hemerythrin superfamily protein/uncharacterized membrane protein